MNKPCARCGVMMMNVRPNRHYCNTCGAIKNLHRSRKKARRKHRAEIVRGVWHYIVAGDKAKPNPILTTIGEAI